MQLVMLTSWNNLTISLGVATMQAEMATNYGLIMAGAAGGGANRSSLPHLPKNPLPKGLYGAVKG